MMFPHYRAAQTAHAILSVLARQWPNLDDETRRAIEEAIRLHGPEIANPTTVDEVRPVLELLDGLRALKSHLPAAACAALDEAWGAPDQFTIRLAPEERQRLQEDMLALVDFRVYRDARGLAQYLSGLLSLNQGRLTPDEQQVWRELDEAFTGGGDPRAYLAGIERLLSPQVTVVARLLEEGKTLPRVVRASDPASALEGYSLPQPIQDRPKAGDAMPVVSRYANVFFPSSLLVTQRRVPLIVHLARERAAGAGEHSEPGALSLGAGELMILLLAEDFSLESYAGGSAVPGLDNARVVQIDVHRDSEPVVFFLTPRTAGSKRIVIDLYQNDRNVRSLSLQVKVVSDCASLGDVRQTGLESVPIEAPVRGAAAPPPDLELRVLRLADDRTLSYTLHSPASADYNHQPAGQIRFDAPPLSALSPTMERLSGMARSQAGARTPDETARAMAELSDIGYNLFDQLFPPELKEQYRRFRETHRGKSLLITTDEPWIPWEIIRPFATDAAGTILYDDPPLCEMFRVSRWFAGRGTPDYVPIHQGVWIAPSDNLQAAQEESDYFSGINRHEWSVRLEGPHAKLAEVESHFEDGQTELFHFACHGNFNTDDPGESKLKLAGDFLRPSQLVGRRRAGLQRSRPVVFLNACHSSRVGAGLTGLGGWAKQFIDSGASAFIGSLWEINDALAARFSREFYNRLLGLEGQTALPFGEAFHDARLALKQVDPANPTWLAYVLYADPYGRAVLGSSPVPARA